MLPRCLTGRWAGSSSDKEKPAVEARSGARADTPVALRRCVRNLGDQPIISVVSGLSSLSRLSPFDLGAVRRGIRHEHRDEPGSIVWPPSLPWSARESPPSRSCVSSCRKSGSGICVASVASLSSASRNCRSEPAPIFLAAAEISIPQCAAPEIVEPGLTATKSLLLPRCTSRATTSPPLETASRNSSTL